MTDAVDTDDDPNHDDPPPRPVKLLLVAEVDLSHSFANERDREAADPDPVGLAQCRLDAFRFAVLPEQEYGITLYLAPIGEVREILAAEGYTLVQKEDTG